MAPSPSPKLVPRTLKRPAKLTLFSVSSPSHTKNLPSSTAVSVTPLVIAKAKLPTGAAGEPAATAEGQAEALFSRAASVGAIQAPGALKLLGTTFFPWRPPYFLAMVQRSL